DDLHTAPPALHPLSVAVLLRRCRVRSDRRIAAARREAGTAIAPRCRILAHSNGRRGVAPPPPGEGSARRNDRDPLDVMACRRPVVARRGTAGRSRRGGVVTITRHRAPWLHSFPT